MQLQACFYAMAGWPRRRGTRGLHSLRCSLDHAQLGAGSWERALCCMPLPGLNRCAWWDQRRPTGLRLQDGVCDKACYPPGEKQDGGDWASRDAVCASGLTYMNKAEAQVRACLVRSWAGLLLSEAQMRLLARSWASPDSRAPGAGRPLAAAAMMAATVAWRGPPLLR